MILRRYSELIQLSSFEDRFDYLCLHGEVGLDTFGFDRVFNQKFYRSAEWRKARNHIIARDQGCDLADKEHPILGERIIIHHLNPITMDDITNATELLLDPEFLICTAHLTHLAIHYGDKSLLPQPPVERRPNDTCPWRH